MLLQNQETIEVLELGKRLVYYNVFQSKILVK